jgi:ribonuclease P protein component
MLKKTARLLKQKDFDRLHLKGRTLHQSSILLKILQNESDSNRFGIIVSNKIDKKATVRNKIKRQLRAIIRKKERIILPGNDLVIIVKKNILNLNFAQIETAVTDLLKRAKILKVEKI